jgi:glucosylglycerate hydrolase
MHEAQLRSEAYKILESAWRPKPGYCVPHATVYLHLWLWDSCFHSIAWASLRDGRALREVEAVFAKQFQNGFVPHMLTSVEN